MEERRPGARAGSTCVWGWGYVNRRRGSKQWALMWGRCEGLTGDA